MNPEAPVERFDVLGDTVCRDVHAGLPVVCIRWGTVTVPNAFSPGTPAKAAEVNANFNAVATAVNGSASDIEIGNTRLNSSHESVSRMPSSA